MKSQKYTESDQIPAAPAPKENFIPQENYRKRQGPQRDRYAGRNNTSRLLRSQNHQVNERYQNAFQGFSNPGMRTFNRAYQEIQMQAHGKTPPPLLIPRQHQPEGGNPTSSSNRGRRRRPRKGGGPENVLSSPHNLEDMDEGGGIKYQLDLLRQLGITIDLSNRTLVPWKCYFCNASCQKKDTYKSHLSTAKHQEQMRHLSSGQGVNKVHAIVSKLLLLPTNRRQSDGSKPKRTVRRKMVRCYPCKLKFPNSNSFACHCAEASHEQRVKYLKEKFGEKWEQYSWYRDEDAPKELSDQEPIGISVITRLSGYYCKVCKKYFSDEGKAKNLHCREPQHVLKYQDYEANPAKYKENDSGMELNIEGRIGKSRGKNEKEKLEIKRKQLEELEKRLQVERHWIEKEKQRLFPDHQGEEEILLEDIFDDDEDELFPPSDEEIVFDDENGEEAVSDEDFSWDDFHDESLLDEDEEEEEGDGEGKDAEACGEPVQESEKYKICPDDVPEGTVNKDGKGSKSGALDNEEKVVKSGLEIGEGMGGAGSVEDAASINKTVVDKEVIGMVMADHEDEQNGTETDSADEVVSNSDGGQQICGTTLVGDSKVVENGESVGVTNLVHEKAGTGEEPDTLRSDEERIC